MKLLRTPAQERRMRRDAEIYADYTEMMSVPGQSKTEVAKKLMEKYGVASMASIYVIRKRVEERLKLGIK